MAATAACVALPSTASAANALSTFTSTDQGWLVAHDNTCGPPVGHAPTHSAAGGNPGGFISATDNEPGPSPGDPDECSWFTGSPAGFAGQLRGNYGGTFSVDVFHPAGAEFGGNVNIVGGQGSLQRVGTAPPANTWTTYSFSLTETSPGWIYFNSGGDLVGPPTKAQFFAVLADVDQIQMFGDLSTNTRGDTTGLDNIELAEPPSPLDSDGDGVSDAADVCPTVVGPASNNGCPAVTPPPTDPDDDGDGIPNSTDACPNQAGPASNNGCPEGVDPPGGDDDAACDKAKKKLKAAKAKLKLLKQSDASASSIKKAKKGVKKAKAAVKKKC